MGNVTNSTGMVSSEVVRNFALCMCILQAATIFGNALVIWVFLVKRVTTNAVDLLIASLAVGDVLLSVSRLSVLGSLFGDGWANDSILCQLFGFLQTVAVSTSLHSLALIAINRYISVCCSHEMKSRVTPNLAKILVLSVWGLGCILALPPLLGWSEYRYFPTTANCYFSQSAAPSYHAMHVSLTFGIATIVNAVSYWRIYRTLRSHQMASSELSEAKNMQKSPEIKLTNTLFLIGLSFAMSYFPPAVTGIISTALSGDNTAIRMIGVAMHYMAGITHPIVYAFINPRLRRSVLAALGISCSAGRRREITPSSHVP